MHAILNELSDNILKSALGALSQANMHAAFFDPGNEHWGNVSVVNATHAGELVVKAAIAQQHPLLIFKDVFKLDDYSGNEISLDTLLRKAKTHEFQHLPMILWAVCKERIPDQASFDEIRAMRNNVQHFFHPAGLSGIGQDAREASLRFLYKNVDPLLKRHFDLCAIEYHEDHSVGYDYLVKCLIQHELEFSIPDDFNLTEISLKEEARLCGSEYVQWLKTELRRVEKLHLLE